ncbi:sensor histidine kinase [Ekhidna sp.]|uniref:sensor histidine kinase n=1 Tax=Ekhidna sp. TaxID=2608089 RepID=UPI003C7C04B2
MNKKLILSILVISAALEAEYFVELWIYDELSHISVPVVISAYLAFLLQTFIQLLLICFINVWIITILEKKYPWGQHFILRSIIEFFTTTLVAWIITIPVVIYIDYGYLIPLFRFESDSAAITLYYNLLYITVINALFIVTYEVVFLYGERNRIKLDYEQSRSKAILAQFEALKNQVNPHFLLNSMHTMVELINHDQIKARKFCEEFINIYRTVLTLEGELLIPINEEISFVKSYIELYQIQFEGQLKVDFDIGSNIEGSIPPFSLQLLIENAFKHNSMSKDRPLLISVKKANGYIEVVNETIPKSSGSTSTKVGLTNLKERYSLLGDYEVVIDSNDTHFKVFLPIL